MMRSINVLMKMLVICCVLAATPIMATTQYVARDILPTDAYAGMALGVSNSGFVVGTYKNSIYDTGQAFIWNAQRGFRTLSVPGTAFDVAFAVNDQGIAVGQYHDAYNNSYACVWDADGNFHDLGLSPGVILAVNNNGRAVGGGYIWDLNGNPSLVASFCGDSWGINDSGQIVGTSSFYGTDRTAFVRETDGTMRALESNSTYESRAAAINNLGQAVGFYQGGLPSFWDSNGNRSAIDVLAGDYGGWARDINDAGVVVGASWSYTTKHAFVWTQDDGLQILSGLGGNNTYATGINSSGLIVGYASLASAPDRAVIWTPVPEPSSLGSLVMTGILGVLSIGRRRCKVQSKAPRGGC